VALKTSAEIEAELEQVCTEIAEILQVPLEYRTGRTSMKLTENLNGLERRKSALTADLRVARMREGRSSPLERRLY
jgi:hypothetical protein